MDKDKKLLAGGILGGILVGANASKIIKGVGLGLVLIVISFILVSNSVNNVEENSLTVADVELIAAEDLGENRELVKAFGTLDTSEPLNLEIFRCNSEICIEPEIVFSEEDLLYYDLELQRFEVIREVEESEQVNDTTTETVSYSNEWITYVEEEKWADVSLSGIEVDPEDARVIADTESEELENIFIEDLDPLQTYDREPDEDQPDFGTTRAVISYIPNDNREYIVIGENRSNGITSGDPYIITDLSDSELIAQLGGEETTTRNLLRLGAFLLLTIGFTSMLSPILVFTDMIPIAGTAARSAATLVSAILAGIIVVATVLLLSYWWLIAIIILLGVLGVGGYLVLPQLQGKTSR